ncbi:hypothetical protein BH11BAC5_BH11BAC5_32380 [soil metagenome]
MAVPLMQKKTAACIGCRLIKVNSVFEKKTLINKKGVTDKANF